MLIIAPWLFYVRALPIRLPDIFIQSGPVKVRYILNVSITADLLSLHHVTRTNLAHFQDATNQKRRFKSTTPRYQTRTNKPADQIALTYQTNQTRANLGRPGIFPIPLLKIYFSPTHSCYSTNQRLLSIIVIFNLFGRCFYFQRSQPRILSIQRGQFIKLLFSTKLRNQLPSFFSAKQNRANQGTLRRILLPVLTSFIFESLTRVVSTNQRPPIYLSIIAAYLSDYQQSTAVFYNPRKSLPFSHQFKTRAY